MTINSDKECEKFVTKAAKHGKTDITLESCTSELARCMALAKDICPVCYIALCCVAACYFDYSSAGPKLDPLPLWAMLT